MGSREQDGVGPGEGSARDLVTSARGACRGLSPEITSLWLSFVEKVGVVTKQFCKNRFGLGCTLRVTEDNDTQCT